jgi:hypothetical protein
MINGLEEGLEHKSILTKTTVLNSLSSVFRANVDLLRVFTYSIWNLDSYGDTVYI